MAVDKLVDSAQLNSDLTSVANAIRTKGGTSAQLAFPSEFISAINAISGGGGEAVVVTETPDIAGGTVKEITAVDISNDTVDAAHLLQGYTAHDSSGNAVIGSYVPQTASLQAKTNISPTTSSQTITPDSGYDGLSSVQINAMPSGTAGTPTATKGTVSNHSVTVTPSVTNTTGYITGSTKTGTAVTVSASELVSGSETKTANGTYDVTNLASLVVNVSGGGGKNVQYNSGAASAHATTYTSTGISITVSKTGTYNVSWMAWRSSSQGAMGTNLYKNGNAGTNQTTWTNTYGQHISLTNQSYTAGDVLTLYATSGSTTRYCWAGNLIIEEQ